MQRFISGNLYDNSVVVGNIRMIDDDVFHNAMMNEKCPLCGIELIAVSAGDGLMMFIPECKEFRKIPFIKHLREDSDRSLGLKEAKDLCEAVLDKVYFQLCIKAYVRGLNQEKVNEIDAQIAELQARKASLMGEKE